MIDLTGKTALITGASRGIGKSIAEAFAKLGCQIVVNGTNVELTQKVADELSEKYSVKTLAQAGSVASAAFVDSMVKDSLTAFGNIDILMNNAGITRDGLLMRSKEEDWDSVMDINLKGAFLCTKAVIRPMLKSKKGGRIINMASVVGVMGGGAGQANYAASKGGLIAFTKSMAREIASKNITVNAIAPGYIVTDMTDQISDQAKEFLMNQIPLDRFGTTEDIANCAAFIASDLSGYITGQTISVNGGMFMS